MYTLNDLCNLCYISAPLFKKIQMKFDLGVGVMKGKRTWYSDEQLKTLKTIVCLRFIGIEYFQIKDILNGCDDYNDLISNKKQESIDKINYLRKVV